MTKDEKKYYDEYFNKLNESYMRAYYLFNKRIKYAILNNRDLKEIKLEVLEMFYRNQNIGKKVEEVIGNDKDMFFREIIDSYYENTPNLKLIKEILRRGLSFSVIMLIAFELLLKTSAVTLLIIPVSFFITIGCYLITRYINNTIFRETLNFFVSIFAIFMFYKFSETYKNMYILSNYTMIFIIIFLSIILAFLYKKSK